MKLGKYGSKGPMVFLAPMAGVTDHAFRMLCREQGCDILCTEMVSAKALYYMKRGRNANRATLEILKREQSESPIAAQLFGSEPSIIASQAAMLAEYFDIIDINMGCPVNKVVKNGEGAALMLRPELACEIVRQTVNAVKVPVTVKIRAGFYDGGILAPEFAAGLEAAGAAAITVHARTARQMYSGRADWNVIAMTKSAVKIPVIGNGDIFSAKDAERMIAQTGCDGIMVARGAQGNPWVFAQIRSALDGVPLPEAPGLRERGEMVLRHGRRLCDDKGEYAAIRQMRSHIASYSKGMRDAANVRRAASAICTYADLEAVVHMFFY